MKRMNFTRIVTALLYGFCAYGQPGSVTSRTNDLKLLSKELTSYRDILQIPGMAVAVVKDGRIVYRKVEGYANLEKKMPLTDGYMFQIASVTKTFTANLMMQYEQEHKASVEDYALNYRFINTYFGWPYNVDANTRIRHFLSHTSEDGPGNSFIYNGQRFNYIYGVFEAAGGHAPFTDGYSLELQKRIFEPLHMEHTIAGFPDTRKDTLFKHIATPYVYDKLQHAFKEDTVNYRWTQAFPATGILSTLGDLAKYTTSYDNNKLITAANYTKVTTPQTLTDGSKSPYGIGWFTEEFEGKKIHWHYGHADSYAALLVRVPETGYTFILLSNSGAPSDALRLGAGHIWQSPFVTSFLKQFIFTQKDQKYINWNKGFDGIPRLYEQSRAAERSLLIEEIVGQALFRRYSEKLYGTHTGESKQLMSLLYELKPERFDQYDPALIYLLTDLQDKLLETPLKKLIAAYESYGHIQPYVIMDIARYYERSGKPGEALRFYKLLADSKGFETWNEMIEACRKAGGLLLDSGKTKDGRTYYWKAVNSMKMNGYGDKAIMEVINMMK